MGEVNINFLLRVLLVPFTALVDDDFEYKGYGINVGIIEPSAIDPNAFDGRNDLPDITINSDWQQGDEMSEHSRRVTRIIGNMAPKISLYTRKLGDNNI